MLESYFRNYCNVAGKAAVKEVTTFKWNNRRWLELNEDGRYITIDESMSDEEVLVKFEQGIFGSWIGTIGKHIAYQHAQHFTDIRRVSRPSCSDDIQLITDEYVENLEQYIKAIKDNSSKFIADHLAESKWENIKEEYES